MRRHLKQYVNVTIIRKKVMEREAKRRQKKRKKAKQWEREKNINIVKRKQLEEKNKMYRHQW
jgi:hypothetical protein